MLSSLTIISLKKLLAFFKLLKFKIKLQTCLKTLTVNLTLVTLKSLFVRMLAESAKFKN